MPPELPLGAKLKWNPVELPQPETLSGSHVMLRPVDPGADAEPLYDVSHLPNGDPTIWTYLPDGPYESPEHLRQMLLWAKNASRDGHVYFAIVPLPKRRPAGIASYLRIEPEFGTIEIGHVWLGRPLQRTTAATEAIYLLARHALEDLGYRRLEWKCDALNQASRRAAKRFGFSFEGIFRNHQVVKGRNRDTAWFAITNEDWPQIQAAFQVWLAKDNFEADGRQRKALSELMADREDALSAD